MTIFSLYAIHLFQCIDFIPFCILQMTQELNISEEVQQGKNVYQELRSFCQCLSSPGSAICVCGAGRAPRMFHGAVLAPEVFCGATVALVSFSVGIPPLSLFPGVHQGVSPVLCSCS